MSNFARQQYDFQRSILTGDDAILADLLDRPREARGTLFGVYRYAYVARLVEVMSKGRELLHAYLGGEMFNEKGRAHASARPSENANLRWFSRGAPEFLRSCEPYSRYPILSDLAAIERALNDAFDGLEESVLVRSDVTRVAPEIWKDLHFRPHPTALRLTLASAIWLSLKDNDEMLPGAGAVALDEPSRLLIWRQDVTALLRELTPEEAMMRDGGRPRNFVWYALLNARNLCRS